MNYRRAGVLQELSGHAAAGSRPPSEFFQALYYLSSLYIETAPEWIVWADAAESLYGAVPVEEADVLSRLILQFPLSQPLPQEYRRVLDPRQVAHASPMLLEYALYDGEDDKALEELEKLLFYADDTQAVFEKILEIGAMKPGTLPVLNSLFTMFGESPGVLRDHYLIQALRYLLLQRPDFVPKDSSGYDLQGEFQRARDAGDEERLLLLMHAERAVNNLRLRSGDLLRILSYSMHGDDGPEGGGGDTLKRLRNQDSPDAANLVSTNIRRFIKQYHPELRS